MTDGDVYKRTATFKVLENCISVIESHYKPERRKENALAITSMSMDLGELLCSNFVFTEWKNSYGFVTKTNKSETIDMFSRIFDAFKNTMDNIQKIDDQPFLHNAVITLCISAIGPGHFGIGVAYFKWLINEENEKLEIDKELTKER